MPITRQEGERWQHQAVEKKFGDNAVDEGTTQCYACSKYVKPIKEEEN